MRKLLVLLATSAALLAILAAGCGAARAAGNGSQPPASVPALEGHSLAGTSWVLVSYGDPANLKTVIAETKVTLNFNSDTTQIRGNGGINGYGGDAVRTDNQLTVSSITYTQMGSPDNTINEQENAYFKLLGSARNVDFGNGNLTINCDGGPVLVFNAAPATTPPASPTTCLATPTPVPPPPVSSGAPGVTSTTVPPPITTAVPPTIPASATPA